jgi:hypothetical protein
MSDMFSDTQMDGLSNEDKAKRAIEHVLRIMNENHEVGYHLGLGTQSFALLTEAAAALWGEPVDQVRHKLAPRSVERAATELIHEIDAYLATVPFNDITGCRVKEILANKWREKEAT